MIDWLPVSLLDWLMLALVSLLVLLTLFSLLRRIWRGKPGQAYVQRVMFSPEAATALELLEQAAGDQLRVFPAVQMNEVLELAPTLKKTHREAALQALFGEKLDFVLCSPRDLRVRLVVALVDDSLSQADGRHRHRLLEQIETAGLPVVHLSPKDWPTPEALRDELNALLRPAAPPPSLAGGRQEPVLSLPDDEPDDDSDEPRFRL
ncbi:DUF2726 domain-containing protein [Oceanimonas sp. CHS3-5]|uniref:DUF2726 domain-containing protein n=1 Tax=Oceanimonas sp. CHS3-5 TaxID=3068186 RepID=UPI00273FE378|nr:DUF2726 domain-containing protein [Oceanimonas sp. CHS3-5]MDP5290765.1 DUF2726 domain-containing protein [Oceanimonas sp. CHS3-5]